MARVHAAPGIASPERIESYFDAVSYQKGAAVLRMLRAYMNRASLPGNNGLRRRRDLRASAQPDAFMAALTAFVRENAYKTATSEQLLQSLTAQTGQHR